MIKIALADNYPIIHYGLEAFFRNDPKIGIVKKVYNYNLIEGVLSTNEIDILLIDLDLVGQSSIMDLKILMSHFPATKTLFFSNYSERIYASNCIKLGFAGYVHKSEKLDFLRESIVKVYKGEIIINESIKRSLHFISKQSKSDRPYRKLSNREIEVLRHLSDGKKNNEIAAIIGINEKTVSTYRLRLQIKLNVTNLLDLVNKAKTLDIA